jgi:hypothetical protein
VLNWVVNVETDAAEAAMHLLRTILLAGGLLFPVIASSADPPVEYDATGPIIYEFDPKLAVQYGKLINFVYAMNNLAVPPHEFTPPYDGLPSQYNFTG